MRSSVKVVDECAAVENEASVFSDPNLVAAELVAVVGVETVADGVVVVPQGQDSSSFVSLVVSGERQPAQTATIQMARSVAPREDGSSLVGSEFIGEGESQGVGSRVGRSDEVWGHPVAANFG